MLKNLNGTLRGLSIGNYMVFGWLSFSIYENASGVVVFDTRKGLVVYILKDTWGGGHTVEFWN